MWMQSLGLKVKPTQQCFNCAFLLTATSLISKRSVIVLD